MIMQEEEDIIKGGLGTLTISPEGNSRFVGSFAGSEYLGQPQRDEEEGQGENGFSERENEGSSSSPQEERLETSTAGQIGHIGHVGYTGLATPPATGRGEWTGMETAYNRLALHGASNIPGVVAGGGIGVQDVESLRAQLPEWDNEGRLLCESYWENVNWM